MLKWDTYYIQYSKVWVQVAQSCPAHCNPRNSPGQNTGVGSLPFSRGSSQPRDQTQVSCIAGGFFTIRATKEAPYLSRVLLSFGLDKPDATLEFWVTCDLYQVVRSLWLTPSVSSFFFFLVVPGLSCGMWALWSSLQHVGSSSLTRDRTWAICIGSMES